MFISTIINKLDKKGRISVPASFRGALATESYQGVVLFRAQEYPALEGFPVSYMQEISERLDQFDLLSSAQDDLATMIFADSVQLPLDGDGRIILPATLIEYASLSDKAAFVGMGQKFQIWQPEAFEKRKEDARKAVKSKKLTIPKGAVS